MQNDCSARAPEARAVTYFLHRQIDAWFNAADDRRTLYLLLAFVPASTVFAILTHATTDLHQDLSELYAWGLSPAWGYDKHPPMGAWIAAAWFAVFPPADWAFYLLAALNGALGLYAVDLVAREYLAGDKRLLALLLLLLAPTFTLHGYRMGSSTLLFWAWPLATFCFVRAFRTRAPGWAAAAGLAAALAMLCKYYSGVLIAGFVLAALTHPDRRRYFRSSSPWLSAIVGLAVLAPNLVWLVSAKGSPLQYALGMHAAGSFAISAAGIAMFLIWALAYCSLMLFAFAYAARPRWQAIIGSLWPCDPDLRLLAVIFLTCLVLPILLGLALKIRLVSLWSLSALFFLPILLLAPDQVRIPRLRAVRVAQMVIACAAVLILTTPVQAYARLVSGSFEGKERYRLVVHELDRLWRDATDQRLSVVGGTRGLAASVSFYHPDHPRMLTGLDDNSPGGPLAGRGIAILCRMDRPHCLSYLDRWVAERPISRRHEIEVTRIVYGVRGVPGRYAILICPPTIPDTRAMR